jgi:hypothetical protein
VDRAHGSVDHGRTAIYGSTVDHGRQRLKGSPELTLGAAPVSGSSPAVGEKEEEASGVPTVGEGGRCGAGGRPAMVDHNGGGLELGVGRVEARRVEIESGTRCAFNAFNPSVLGGERRGEWGVRGGGMWHHFWERRGHRGTGSTRGRWRWWPVGLPEEEDGRAH